MRTKIQKWGNSLGLRIPKSFAEEVSVEAGSTVDITVDRGRLIIRLARHPFYRLEDLVMRIQKSNLHDEIPTGDATGREAW